MSDKIYTKSETGKKWHIRHTPGWTLCYQPCGTWQVSDRPVDYYTLRLGDEMVSGVASMHGEVCQKCQAIAEAIKTGEGVPF